jgi:hypothetical protein
LDKRPAVGRWRTNMGRRVDREMMRAKRIAGEVRAATALSDGTQEPPERRRPRAARPVTGSRQRPRKRAERVGASLEVKTKIKIKNELDLKARPGVGLAEGRRRETYFPASFILFLFTHRVAIEKGDGVG